MAIPNWLHLSTLSGSGDTIVTITADTYQELTERLADLVISGHTKSVTLPVSQAPQSLRVRPSRIVVGSAATTTTLYVTSSQDWSLTSGVTFGTLSQVSGGSGTTTISFTTTQNTTGSNRYGNLVFESGEDTATVPVTQYNDMKWDIEATYMFGSSDGYLAAYAGLLDDVFEVDGVLYDKSGGGYTYGTNGYLYMSLGSGLHTVRYNSIIPGTICSYVFSVANSSHFLPMVDLKVNDSIGYINWGAFNGCNQLTSVTLSEGVEYIGSEDNWCLTIPYGNSVSVSWIFSSPVLSALTIPSTVKYIDSLGLNLFALTGLTIPSGCEVRNLLKADSTGFTISNFTLNFPSDAYAGKDNVNTWDVVSGYTEVSTVSNGLQYIGPILVGVADKTRTSYTISSGTRYIVNNCFDNCYDMTGVTIPSSVETNLGVSYFDNTSLPVVNGIKYAGDRAIQATAASGSLVFSAGTKIINCSARANRHITAITIPDGVETVSLGGVSEVSALTIPSSVTSFYAPMSSLVSVTVPDSIDYCAIPGAPIEIKTSKIYVAAPPNSTSVSIPSGIETISESAFRTCMNTLTAVTIPNTVKTINDSAFSGCTALTTVSIPSSVKTIGGYAFADCGLTSVTFSNGLETIGYGAFGSCQGLTSVTIPSSVNVLGGFINCQNLVSISIPNGVEEIGEFCFENCYSLTGVTIPSSVDTIGAFAFLYCTAMTRVSISHMPSSAHEGIFNGCGVTAFTMPSDAYYVFELNGCNDLTRINIPESVRLVSDIGHSCTALTSIYSYAVDAPHVTPNTFGYGSQFHVATNGTLHYPSGTDYSKWLSNANYYLGYYNWTGVADL